MRWIMSKTKINEITVKDLSEKLKKREDFYLLDVREKFEKELADIGGQLIPLMTLQDHLNEIPNDKLIVVYCKSGGRSLRACQFIFEAKPGVEIYNLQGGILAWSEQIDHNIKKY